MRDAHHRAIGLVLAAFLFAAVLAFSKIDAAETSSHTSDLTNVSDAVLATWTASWDASNGTASLRSGASEWYELDGLAGRQVYDAVFSPGYAVDHTAFVATAIGIYRTQDLGGTWKRVLATKNVVANIALSPAFVGDGVGFAISNSGGLWRTSDGGATWESVDANLNGFSITLSPAYAADQTIFIGAFDGIRRSTDNGATWVDVSGGIAPNALVNGDIRGIALDVEYSSNSTVYVSTLGSGLFRSTDSGSTWTSITPAGIPVPYATTFAVMRGRVAVLYLNGVYESTDAGGSWRAIYTGDDALDIAYVPDGSLIVARVSGPAKVVDGSVIPIAAGWSGGQTSTIGVASTYPAHGSVIAGRMGGGKLFLSGFSPSGYVQSEAGIDGVPYLLTQATLTATATTPTGTSVTYEMSVADANPSWEGPVALGQPWKFKAKGSTLRWRAMLASTNPKSTPILDAVTVAYYYDSTMPSPVMNGAESQASSIRWQFTSSAKDVTGFAVARTKDGKVVATTEDIQATYVEELNLKPDTEYCGRRVYARRDAERSPASDEFPCTRTLAATPGAPSVVETSSSSALLALDPGSGNGTGVTYAIRDTTSGLYVGWDGAFGISTPTWRTIVGWQQQTTIIGLTPQSAYSLCVIARNTGGAQTPCSQATLVETQPGSVIRGDITASLRTDGDGVILNRGDIIEAALTLTQLGNGPVNDVLVTIPIPSGSTYVPGSLLLGDVEMTDVLDGDAGDGNISLANSLSFKGLALSVGGSRILHFRLVVSNTAEAFVQIAPTMQYRPNAAKPIRTVAVRPVSFDIAAQQVAPEIPEVPADTEVGEVTEPIVPEVVEQEPIGEPTIPPPEQTPIVDAGEQGAPPTEAPPAVDVGSPTTTEPVLAANPLVLVEPKDGSVIGGGDIVVRGQATPEAQVRIVLDGSAFWMRTVGSDGSFSASITGVAPGVHRITTLLPPYSVSAQITVSSAAPDSVEITAPISGAVTNAETIVVSGRGPADEFLAIMLDARTIAEVPTDARGDFSFVLPGRVDDGVHRIEVSVKEHSNARAVASFVVDRMPPGMPMIDELRIVRREPSEKVEGAFDVTLEIRGALDEASLIETDAVLISIASDPVTFTHHPRSNRWTFTTTLLLEPGAHEALIALRDLAGNISLAPQRLTFDVRHAECSDGLDNDDDGLIDYPDDIQCSGPFDMTEAAGGGGGRLASAVQQTASATAETVATATTVTAKATAQVAEQAATIVQKRVLDNPNVEMATERVVAPAVVVAVATSTATAGGAQLFTFGQYVLGFLLSPGRLFGRRKRKGWGTVYASLSKHPADLATVRLIDEKTGRVAQTEVTDALGRYSFQVKQAGTYRIEVRHADFSFPSAQIQGKKEDFDFTDLYFGETITVPEGGAFIARNIPIDARADAVAAAGASVVRRHYGRVLSGAVSDIGLVLSVGSFAVSPRPYVGIILGVNLLLYITFRRLASKAKETRSWGAVREDGTKDPIRLAVVRLFDEEFNKLLETAATDRYGRYRFLVGKNRFYVTAQKPQYALATSPVIDLTRQEGVIGVDLNLRHMDEPEDGDDEQVKPVETVEAHVSGDETQEQDDVAQHVEPKESAEGADAAEGNAQQESAPGLDAVEPGKEAEDVVVPDAVEDAAEIVQNEEEEANTPHTTDDAVGAIKKEEGEEAL
ncbi:MAG: hypothetical protein ABIG71_04540 [Candidatus Uhrbacteria bacterium]